MKEFLHYYILSRIEKKGRALATSAMIQFDDRNIVVEGEDIFVSKNLLQRLSNTSAFYLSLPPNVFGIVIYPDGVIRNLDGGLHTIEPGLYKLIYVDRSNTFAKNEVRK